MRLCDTCHKLTIITSRPITEAHLTASKSRPAVNTNNAEVEVRGPRGKGTRRLVAVTFQFYLR